MFRLALSRGRQQDALFWADELFSSGCLPQLNQILFEVWLFYKGISDCKWFLLWYGSDHDYNDAICNTVRLCWSIRDGIDIRVLLEIINPGPTPDLKEASKVVSPLREKVFSILGRICMDKRAAISAFWRVANRDGALKLRPYRSVEAEDIIFPSEQLPVQRAWIYGLCDRGQMSEAETTIDEVRGNIIETLWGQGSMYWSNAFLGYDAQDDDLVEEFYQKHFPNDIPDEWSLEAQMRTHGPGSLFRTESGASIIKLLRLLFPGCEGLTKCYSIIGDKKIPEGARTLFDIFP
jgi:hypothetical protein